MAWHVRFFSDNCANPVDYFAADIDRYLTEIGYPTPQHTNPADQAIAIINTEFYDEESSLSSSAHLDKLSAAWVSNMPKYYIHTSPTHGHTLDVLPINSTSVFLSGLRKTLIITERNLLNYVRNLLAFGIRS